MKPLPELISLINSLPEPHILFDTHYRILAANPAYRRQFSTQDSVIGRTCYQISHHFNQPCDQAGESCPLAAARASGQRERVLHLHHTPKGEEYVNIELVPLLNAQGEAAYYVEKMAPLPLAQGPAQPQGLIGRSPAFVAMLGLVARVAPSQASVLLLGESGTGKELVARALHEASTRAQRPLVPVDCSSLPENLFESELFGHERGAFTGANTARAGLVEAASGGTLFLDEVGDIPLSMQVKLLRLLETGTYRRVGSTEQRHADIRIVSATHRDLHALIEQGQFREDLYYRLSTFPIRLPALRERQEDIERLAPALLERVAPGRTLRISEPALSRLKTLPYPGNVRELRNLLERATLLCDGETLLDTHIEAALAVGRPMGDEATPRRHGDPAAADDVAGRYSRPSPTPGLGVRADLRTMTRQALRMRLAQHQGSRAELARALGISERSLYRKIRELKLLNQ